ncbi:MAG: hypothetical protein MUC62_04895 [Candidatus Thermoplasmatota archaeon]|jgi:hypothetical protein|nr:hypothetical protein [Candidatus Thermoplasmatota archaeon]
MEGYADCKICKGGSLLPFTSPDGYMVYFCNNCGTRFSGYYDEPLSEGVPVFSERAFYTSEQRLEEGFPIQPGRMMDAFRKLLDDNPPKPQTTKQCGTCGCFYGDGGIVIDLCSLPEP